MCVKFLDCILAARCQKHFVAGNAESFAQSDSYRPIVVYNEYLCHDSIPLAIHSDANLRYTRLLRQLIKATRNVSDIIRFRSSLFLVCNTNPSVSKNATMMLMARFMDAYRSVLWNSSYDVPKDDPPLHQHS